MANSIYNKYKNLNQGFTRPPQNNGLGNILAQLHQVQQNPSAILDILAQSGKINQQQYQELQQYKNNPQQIVNYLYNHGNANELEQAKQQMNNLNM